MKPALLALTLAIAAPSLHADTCVVSHGRSTTAASVNLSNPQLSGALADAAEIWNNCGSEAVPNVRINATGTITVTVSHFSGQSTRADGACAETDTTVVDGRVTGGQIRIWDAWGPGSPTVAAGTNCSNHFAGLIAHELGHVFGLRNSRARAVTI